MWFKSYGVFAEWVDFAYWWCFSGEGSASAACAAGLFSIGSVVDMEYLWLRIDKVRCAKGTTAADFAGLFGEGCYCDVGCLGLTIVSSQRTLDGAAPSVAEPHVLSCLIA